MLWHLPTQQWEDFSGLGRKIVTPRLFPPFPWALWPGPWREAAVLVILGALILFRGLGNPGLMDPDEGRYAEIAREMVQGGDWLVPRLNSVPYLEKPPLVYWLTALSFTVFGVTEFAARLPAALAALGGVLWAYVLGRRLGGERQGFWGALVLLTSGGYVVLGRLLTLDMVLATLVNVAVGAGYLAFVEKRRGLLVVAYAALALGTLTKGPVAPVLAALIWGAYTLLDRRERLTFWLHPGGLLLYVALCAPWFGYLSFKHPEFLRFFFWDHHVGRFATAPIHPQPVYFYLPLLVGFLLPWSFLVPWAFLRKRPWTDPAGRFLLLWAGVVVGFFSLSRGKLPPYILPALLPFALLVAWAMAEQEWGRALAGSLWVWLAAGLILGGVYLYLPARFVAELEKIPGLSSYIWAPLGVLMLTPALALAGRRLVPVAWGAVALALLLPGVLTSVSHYRSPRAVGMMVAANWQPGAALVGVGIYSQALSFYAGQPMYLLHCRTELEFGHSLAPANALVLKGWQDLAALAVLRSPLFCLVRKKDWEELREKLPGRWHAGGRYKDCILAVFTGK